MANEITQWFVEPCDAYSNESICKAVFPDGVSEIKVKVHGRKKEATLIPISHQNLGFIEKSKITSHLSFNTFIRRSSTGPVEQSPFVDG